jgi:hypothetical protein
MRNLSISFIVPEELAGRVLADLAGYNLQGLSFKVDEQVVRPDGRGYRKGQKGKVWALFEKTLAKMPEAFSSVAMIAALPKGTPKSSLYTYLAKKAEDKVIKKLGPGQYKKVA